MHSCCCIGPTRRSNKRVLTARKGSIIYVDRYGKYWVTAPTDGYRTAGGDWRTDLHVSDVLRPGSTIVATVHTHPMTRDNGSPDTTGILEDVDGDNATRFPQWVLRGDGAIIYFKVGGFRGDHMGRLYGKIEAGTIITKYASPSRVESTVEDPYKVVESVPGADDGSGSSWLTIATTAAIGSALVTLLVVGGGGGPDIYVNTGNYCDPTSATCPEGNVR